MSHDHGLHTTSSSVPQCDITSAHYRAWRAENQPSLFVLNVSAIARSSLVSLIRVLHGPCPTLAFSSSSAETNAHARGMTQSSGSCGESGITPRPRCPLARSRLQQPVLVPAQTDSVPCGQRAHIGPSRVFAERPGRDASVEGRGGRGEG